MRKTPAEEDQELVERRYLSHEPRLADARVPEQDDRAVRTVRREVLA
jgi:hypothetical protein